MTVKSKSDLRFTLPEQKQSQAGVLALLSGNPGSARALPGADELDDWKRQAALGSPDAQFQLARILTSGEPISADNRLAVKWLRKAAEKEHAASQHMLGVLIARAQGVRADPVKAVELFRSAAIMGNADAQYDLARSLAWGFGCETNFRESLTWFRLAGAQGHCASQYEVGLAYLEGRGCDADLRQAASWLRKAALNHHTDACYELGKLYLRPDYAQADNRDAYRWISEAARSRHAGAQYELALFHLSGRAVEKSPAKSLDWAVRSAIGGEIRAYLLAARILEETGRKTQAYAVLLQALDDFGGNLQKSAEGRELEMRMLETGAQISSAEVAEANELFRSCRDLEQRIFARIR